MANAKIHIVKIEIKKKISFWHTHDSFAEDRPGMYEFLGLTLSIIFLKGVVIILMIFWENLM